MLLLPFNSVLALKNEILWHKILPSRSPNRDCYAFSSYDHFWEKAAYVCLFWLPSFSSSYSPTLSLLLIYFVFGSKTYEEFCSFLCAIFCYFLSLDVRGGAGEILSPSPRPSGWLRSYEVLRKNSLGLSERGWYAYYLISTILFHRKWSLKIGLQDEKLQMNARIKIHIKRDIKL